MSIIFTGRYGAGIFINRINKITNKSYDEIVEKNIFLIFFKSKGEILHLDSVDNFTVFDLVKMAKLNFLDKSVDGIFKNLNSSKFNLQS